MRLITEDYRALSEFRYQIRKFLAASDAIARSGALQPQQYMMLLTLRGLPDGIEPTIAALAERLQIRHNSAVELVNRLAERGLVHRDRASSDSRKVFLQLTAKGASLIEKMVEKRFLELQASQPELIKALNRVLKRAQNKKSEKTASL
jgi:DNA-binding MarR family transcriptional regulator